VKRLVTLSLGVVLGFTLCAVLVANLPSGGASLAEKAPPGPPELTSYRFIVKKVLPAVVWVQARGVRSTQSTRQPDMDPFDDFPFPNDDLRRFFEQFRRGQAEPPRGVQFGSGVIVDPKGLVVTNNHVVAGASEVEVTLRDGRKFISKDIARDPKTDLAIVKLNSPAQLPYAELGDSEQMEIGDRVLAMGAPFGLQGSVTAGIISGKGRHVGLNLLYEDFLQTDAAINPGNSGGPLVNMEGKVIGISTAIRTVSGGFQGVGLAIPSNMVREVVTQLAREGTVRRGYLGIRMQDLTPELAEQLQLQGRKGVVVVQVYPNSPAAKAGLREGDVILSARGQPIENGQELQRKVLATPIGQKLDLRIFRDGQEKTLSVLVEQQPESFGLEDEPSSQRPEPGSTELHQIGLSVVDLTPDLAEQRGYARNARGVLVTQVKPGSLAHLAGIRQGMLIVAVARKPVANVEELKKALAAASLEKGILIQARTPNEGTYYFILRAD